jgi:hypothetical protein
MTGTNWALLAVILVIIVVAAVTVLAFVLVKPHPFDLQEKSVVFYSDEAPILADLNLFSANHSFLVATEAMEGNPYNNSMANASALFQVVLIGNQKSVTQVFMTISSQNRELLSCQTNMGNFSQNREITAEECHSLVDSFSGAKAVLYWPDSKLQRAEVLVKSSLLEIRPSAAEDVQLAAYSSLKKMFPNADEIIGSVNTIAGQIQ